VRQHGTALATFSLPGLTLTDLRDLPVSENVAWGSEILAEGGYTYVYGAEHDADRPKGLRIARTTALAGAWEFWTGTGWSASEADSARVLTGTGTAFSVTKVGAEYVLVTMDGNTTFSSTVVGYSAPAPTGPFGNPRTLFQAPSVSATKPIIYYDTTVHPQYSSGGRLLFSYNVNSLNPDDNFADARIYRPRFVSVDWLAPAPAPENLPPAPENLTAADEGDGTATLEWDPVPGEGYVYRVYQRNVTAESDFTRLSAAYASPKATVLFLRNDEDYEFRVTAENSAGEGPRSDAAALTIHVGKPEPPTALTAVADDKGAIRLHWKETPSRGAITYQVVRRDVTAGDEEARPIYLPDPGSTSTTDRDLEHNHVYSYQVSAWRSGQASDRTPVVSATARYALPGNPLGLTATARDDGQIDLAWRPPEDGDWYFVYQKDLTLEEPDYTKFGYPITTCCGMTVGNLQHGHRYQFVVSATNRGGEGPKSDPATATSTYPPVRPPSGLTATAGDGKVTLRWTASPTQGVWYWVYQRDVTLDQPTFTRFAYPLTTCCEVTAEYLANDHVYEFAVSATGPAGESAQAGPARATPRPPPAAAPQNLTATPQSDGTIKLDWTEATPGVWFNVSMRDVTLSEPFKVIPYPVTTCCTLNAAFLTHNHVYEFRSPRRTPPARHRRRTPRGPPPATPRHPRLRTSAAGPPVTAASTSTGTRPRQASTTGSPGGTPPTTRRSRRPASPPTAPNGAWTPCGTTTSTSSR
jgi:fibronectin type 3 domain-containing protein